ncbi:hypothetical protein [Actinokineospora enzanensis]|uniref:hypothetical protein n=1 Tax=Actinokineospora enzanensis TaxID=155975 RepID=UPI0003768973|nr:hypothetical protein [Actinokineospora enzanensis]
MVERSRLRVTEILLGVAGYVLLSIGMLSYVVRFIIVTLSEIDEECLKQSTGLADPGFKELRWSLLPPQATCVYADGTTYAQMPWWLNPLLFTCLGGALACAAAVIVLGRRR